MKTTYLKGSKRLAIIHRWLQGIDDPNYEVLPTRKEGKYIVKKRQQTEKSTTDESEQSSSRGLYPRSTADEVTHEPATNEEVTEEVTHDSEADESAEEVTEELPLETSSRIRNESRDEVVRVSHSEPSKPSPSKLAPSKQAPSKPALRQQAPRKAAPHMQSQVNTYDPTINLEILEQLKLLGDEIRSKRERKEQKQLINHVIDKRMSKRQVIPKAKQIEEEYYSEEEEQQQQYVFKSRIRR